jgi:hypothetical protein
MLPVAQMVVLIRRYQARSATIATRASALTARQWDQLDDYDRPARAHFAEQVAPTARSSKAAAVALGVGFYAALGSVRPPAIAPDDIAVELDTEAGFIAYANALANGRPWDEAVAAGRARVEAAAQQLVVSSGRRTGDAVAEATGQHITGWERVLDGSSCTWCALISTQRYHSAESADFGHDRCGCTAVPIFGDARPGQVINRPVLDGHP